jgi:hypothetical protein
MNRDDWFRNTTWNDKIAAQFEAKLKRARQKGQYIRIQACTSPARESKCRRLASSRTAPWRLLRRIVLAFDTMQNWAGSRRSTRMRCADFKRIVTRNKAMLLHAPL